jgi:hypothetical protein
MEAVCPFETSMNVCSTTRRHIPQHNNLKRKSKNPSVIKLIIKDCNSLPAGLLASFPCKLNTLRKRVREAVTSKEALNENK